MTDHQPITLSLTVAGATWHKKNRELLVDGKLFDVKQWRQTNGMLTVTGFYDDDETRFLSLLLQLTSPAQQATVLHFFLILQCFAVPFVFFLLPGIANSKHRRFGFFSEKLCAPFCAYADPPPEGCS